MAIRNIVTKEDDVLRKKCRPVEVFDDKLATLIDDMFDTLKKADGAGLAAPQIGILKRVVVIDVGEGPVELVNPEIVKTSGTQVEVEGCLSCPDEWGYVERPLKVKCRAQDRFGKVKEYNAEEMFARCICHELDHLDGKLFIDLVDHILSDEELEELRAEEERKSGNGKRRRFAKRKKK